MTIHSASVRMFMVLLLAASAAAACEQPECIDGPSNLTPQAVAPCAAPPEGTTPETEIVSASAQFRDDGTLVLTWSSFGLSCGVTAEQVDVPGDCLTKGWAITAELAPELVVPGVVSIADHPELPVTVTVVDGGNGGSYGNSPIERPFTGSIEIVDVGDACVTGVLHGFGSGSPDPTLGGPELDGSFVAPRC